MSTLAVVIALLATLLVAPTTATATGRPLLTTTSNPLVPPGGSPPCWCDHGTAPGLATLSYVLAHYRYGFGANWATAYGWANVNSWSRSTITGRYYPNYTLSDRSPALAFRNPALLGCAWWEIFCYSGHPVWYKPTTWDWPWVMAWGTNVTAGLYEDFIKPCMTGAVHGDIGYISGRFLIKLGVWARLAGFAALKANSLGFAVSVVAGCTLSVLRY